MDDPSTLSLFDQIASSGYRASIITTYSCYFPFYEHVVLRRLIAAGCTHNLVFADARRLAESLNNDALRPRLAGVAYTLVPVSVSGAFHPKLLMQVGPGKGSLHVGSHNLTLSGYGLNDELTAAFAAEAPNPRSGAAPFHVAREFLRRFLPESLPEIADAFEAVFEGVSWMSGPRIAAGPPRELLASVGDDADLWSRIRPSVPAGVKRALIVAPYFDQGLRFVRRVLAEIQPQALTVAIDPATTTIPHDAHAQLPGVRFVNIGGRTLVPRRREKDAPFVHAKAYWFEGSQGELLATGSANASGPAMLTESRRNAEALVVDSTAGVANSLGLLDLFEAPEVSASSWALVTAPGDDTSLAQPDRATAMLATPSDNGFRVAGSLRTGLSLNATDHEGAQAGIAVVSVAGPPAELHADPSVRDSATYLAGKDEDRDINIIVHRPDEISRHAATDTRKALQQALGGLDEDPTQIAALLKVTEKVIFDVDENIVSGHDVTPAQGQASAAETSGPASLQVEAQGRRAARKKSLARGDLAYLLDILIRRLGEGLPTTAASRPTEEEQIGSDDEHGGDLPDDKDEPIDLEQLADTCQKKTKTLIKRMRAALDDAHGPGKALRAIVQLAAVEGVLRALCLVERRPEWRHRRLRLVDRKALAQLFAGAAVALAHNDDALLGRAHAEVGTAFEELSTALGLLVALAYLIDLDVVAGPPQFDEETRKADERAYWRQVQYFALIAPALSLDEDAKRTLAQTVSQFAAATPWLPAHLALCDALANLATGTPLATVTTPRRGDWVVNAPGGGARLRVVLDVIPGSAPSGAKVLVADFEKKRTADVEQDPSKKKPAKDKNKDLEKAFVASRVTIVRREDLRAPASTTAKVGAQ